MGKIVTSGNASFWIQDNGILYCKLDSLEADNKLGYKSAQMYLESLEKLIKDNPMPLLIDLRNTKGTISIEAAHLLSESFNKMQHVICEAYVVNTLSVKLLVQGYKRIYKTKIPYGIFEKMDLAEAFCLSKSGRVSGHWTMHRLKLHANQSRADDEKEKKRLIKK